MVVGAFFDESFAEFRARFFENFHRPGNSLHLAWVVNVVARRVLYDVAIELHERELLLRFASGIEFWNSGCSFPNEEKQHKYQERQQIGSNPFLPLFGYGHARGGFRDC
jgi:hypothetical protein